MQIALKNNWREADLLRSQLIPAVSPETWWIWSFQSRECSVCSVATTASRDCPRLSICEWRCEPRVSENAGVEVQNLHLAKCLLAQCHVASSHLQSSHIEVCLHCLWKKLEFEAHPVSRGFTVHDKFYSFRENNLIFFFCMREEKFSEETYILIG